MMTDPDFLERAYGTTDGLAIRIRAQELYGTGTGSIFDEMTAWALAAAPCHAILDIGMGTGKWYQSVRSLCHPTVRYTGLDASMAMVATMQQETAGDSRSTLCHGDAENLPFEDDSFDWVGLHFMLYHVKHPRVALREAWRVTKPGGLVLTLAHGSNSLQSLLAIHTQAVEHCLGRPLPLTIHTYNLDHGADNFPDPSMVASERRASGLRFPDVNSALAYYGSGFWQRGLTDPELQDPGVKRCLFDFVAKTLHTIIGQVGYFDVPGHSGWLWVRKPT